MEIPAEYQAGDNPKCYLTSELIKQLEEKIAALVDGMTGYGEITIVIEARKVMWVRLTESEPAIHTPLSDTI